MNRLYSILVSGASISSSWYAKRTSPVHLDDAAADMVSSLTSRFQDRALAACCLTYLASLSSFWPEIKALDEVNTYSKPARNGSAATGFPDSASLERCMRLIDRDISDRVNTPSLVEQIGACCLWLLRRCNG